MIEMAQDRLTYPCAVYSTMRKMKIFYKPT